MITHPEFDPVAMSLGPVQVHWYGVMYLLAFVVAFQLANRTSRRPWSPIKPEQVEDLIVYGAWGVILGGRLGYMLFYSLGPWLADPILVLRIWQGGMSFHGGLLGVICAALFFARKYQVPFLGLTDFIAPLVPTGLLFGRLGNFIGQELWGRPTDLPWGMLFPADPEQLARHPSQLYEAFGEGLVLFLLISWFARKPRLYGEVSGLFLLGYGTVRFAVEFVRQPDAQFVGQQATIELFNWMTRGQWLCVPMLFAGFWFMRKTVQRVLLEPSRE